MKAINKRVLILAAILLALAAVGYLRETNRGTFQGGRISGLPSGHLRVEHHHGGHLDLLLSHRGEVSYNFYGTGVSVYIAYYERDELILHERVGGIGAGEPYEFSGTAVWGITTEGVVPRELRLRVGMNGAKGFSYFDFSQLGLDGEHPGWSTSSINTRSAIEPRERYVLQVWQTGTTWWVDDSFFNPGRLRESEQTLILYIIFE